MVYQYMNFPSSNCLQDLMEKLISKPHFSHCGARIGFDNGVLSENYFSMYQDPLSKKKEKKKKKAFKT